MANTAPITIKPLTSVDFEVFGRVQKVFFRKHTKIKATSLGLKGWCMNTAQGTVVGQVQGPKPAVDEMKRWLERIGSPKCNIDKALFKKECLITKSDYASFAIRR